MNIYKRIKISLAIMVIALLSFSHLFAPNDPNLVDIGQRLNSASLSYPLGTDGLGRCLFSRLLYGGKTTIGIVLSGSVLVIVLGTFFGLLVCRKKGDQNIFTESLLNAITAIPPIAYLIIFIGAWGNGVFTMLVAITLSLFLRMVKLVKSRSEIEMSKAYIMCAKTSGAGRMRILYVHILPNVALDVFHFIFLSSADMILALVGFSFIGLGLGDNVIDWGTMIGDSLELTTSNPGLLSWPVIFIVATALSFNVLGRSIEIKGSYYA